MDKNTCAEILNPDEIHNFLISDIPSGSEDEDYNDSDDDSIASVSGIVLRRGFSATSSQVFDTDSSENSVKNSEPQPAKTAPIPIEIDSTSVATNTTTNKLRKDLSQ